MEITVSHSTGKNIRSVCCYIQMSCSNCIISEGILNIEENKSSVPVSLMCLNSEINETPSPSVVYGPKFWFILFIHLTFVFILI